MKFIETDPRAGNHLRYLLRSYDDCVRTGDGARYKRPSLSASEAPEGLTKAHAWLQDIQSWKRLLKTLVLNPQGIQSAKLYPERNSI